MTTTPIVNSFPSFAFLLLTFAFAFAPGFLVNRRTRVLACSALAFYVAACLHTLSGSRRSQVAAFIVTALPGP